MSNEPEIQKLNLLQIGCGRMGSALLKGWILNGLKPRNIDVIDPNPAEWLTSHQANGLNINPKDTRCYDVIVIATKPQYVKPVLADLNGNCLAKATIISVAAGVTIAQIEDALQEPLPVIRTMPNTPAEVGFSMTCITGNDLAYGVPIKLAILLMGIVGHVEILQDENQMHAVTATSGSGPAYIFAMAEAMEAGAVGQGLPEELARLLVIHTIIGAGQLLLESGVPPSSLREAVTSPNGTTAAALNVLLCEPNSLKQILVKGIEAASHRSRLLAKNDIMEN